MKRIILCLCFVFLTVGVFCDVALAQDKDISSNIYHDKNGYFALIPPANWKQKDYPGDARSKVAFEHPDSAGIIFRIMAGPTGSTFEEIYENTKTDSIPSLKRMFPTANITIEEAKIGAHKAVKLRLSVEGMVEQEVWQFVAAGITYSVAFSTNNKIQFEANNNILKNFLSSFVVQEKPGRKITEDDIKRVAVANKKRLAELAEEANLLDLAIQHVKEALEIYPDDKSLKAFQERLILKKAKKGE